MRQLALRDWPDGLEEDALQLALAPDDITRRGRISFEVGRDSLDEFMGAVIDLGNGKSFAFQRHAHSPNPGTTVLLRQGSREELEALVDLLELERSEVTWSAPHLENCLNSILRRPQRIKLRPRRKW
jgi:hypothetical protein